MTLYDLVRKKPYLVWYTRNLKGISSEAIVESVLNYILKNMHKNILTEEQINLLPLVKSFSKDFGMKGHEVNNKDIERELVELSLQ